MCALIYKKQTYISGNPNSRISYQTQTNIPNTRMYLIRDRTYKHIYYIIYERCVTWRKILFAAFISSSSSYMCVTITISNGKNLFGWIRLLLLSSLRYLLFHVLCVLRLIPIPTNSCYNSFWFIYRFWVIHLLCLLRLVCCICRLD